MNAADNDCLLNVDRKLDILYVSFGCIFSIMQTEVETVQRNAASLINF